MIDEKAKETGFIKRIRKLPASRFVNTLMFAFCNQAKTSLPDIAADLNQQFNIDISKEGIHKKFNHKAVNFLKALIKEQLSEQFTFPIDNQLKASFQSIKIKDSTKFSLPEIYNVDYPGFGNFSKTNGLMNIQYEYDLINGNWEYIELTNCKRNDQQDSKETIDSISKGDLYIRDLGYITPKYLKAIIQKEACFLNRMPSQINVYSVEKKLINWKDINGKFNKTGVNIIEMEVLIYEKHNLPCRLIIERVDDNEYKRRLKHAESSAKSRNVGLSERHKMRCRYNTFITNVDKKVLPVEKIKKTYYLRWQIELVFKTWKSFFEIDKVKKVKKERMKCQLLAKLLWIVLNWRLFNTCNRHVQKQNPSEGVSALKFFKRCFSFSQTLRQVILKQLTMSQWLKKTSSHL
ncbi:MAG: hypothetical protein ACI9GZ_000240 [Bacteroidia bacterium]|jgi:hypothetical protein